jgi:hypothetical protein
MEKMNKFNEKNYRASGLSIDFFVDCANFVRNYKFRYSLPESFSYKLICSAVELSEFSKI